MSKTAIITGVTGQDGPYLSELLLSKGYRIVGLVRSNLYSNLDRLKYLNILDKIVIEECDLLDMSSIIRILKDWKPDEIYNLAAQSSLELSFTQPINTMQFNTLSVINLLESMKIVEGQTKIFQASSSATFGEPDSLPVTEETRFSPQNLYAISKISAYWTTRNYREVHNLFACSGMLFNHESFLRSSNFVIKKVISRAVAIKNNSSDDKEISVGNIEMVRDFGFAPKYVEAMWLMLQQKEPRDYIICSGEPVSLKDIIYHILEVVGISRDYLKIDPNLYRPVDIEKIYGSNKRIKTELNWEYDLSFYDVVKKLVDEETKNLNSNFTF
ncbi:GDP-mannose 4,6-dehydratase [bacterium AH-315-C07]|nr:GDP-mannose 4,6-dehydratase [bacterium AH-315-C07]